VCSSDLSYKYWLSDNPEISFNQISDMLNMQEKEVSKIHDNAIRKIKNDL
jgi:hypothetical protein